MILIFVNIVNIFDVTTFCKMIFLLTVIAKFSICWTSASLMQEWTKFTFLHYVRTFFFRFPIIWELSTNFVSVIIWLNSTIALDYMHLWMSYLYNSTNFNCFVFKSRLDSLNNVFATLSFKPIISISFKSDHCRPSSSQSFLNFLSSSI